MPDENHCSPVVDVTLTFLMNLRYERARGIEDGKSARLRIVLDGPRYSVRAEDGGGAWWHFCKILYEAGALRLQALNDVTVVHDLMAHIDGRSIFQQRPFYDIDCANNARTIATRLSQYDLHGTLPT
jgi:hypothetical protein